MRYRYITNGMCSPAEPICNFRLVSHKEIRTIAKEPGRTYYRVNIPDDLSLIKYECDKYSTTDDKRTIGELGYDIVLTMSDGSRKILPKDADVKELSDTETKKWTKSLYLNPKEAYHPYPKTKADIELDKEIDREVIFKFEKDNPRFADILKKTYEKKYGEPYKQQKTKIVKNDIER